MIFPLQVIYDTMSITNIEEKTRIHNKIFNILKTQNNEFLLYRTKNKKSDVYSETYLNIFLINHLSFFFLSRCLHPCLRIIFLLVSILPCVLLNYFKENIIKYIIKFSCV